MAGWPPVRCGRAIESVIELFIDRGGGLVHRDDFGDFVDVFGEVLFDAEFEGHGGGGAVDAGALEADLDDAVGSDGDEFEVAAIGLDGGSDLLDDFFDALGEGFGGVRVGPGHGEILIGGGP